MVEFTTPTRVHGIRTKGERYVGGSHVCNIWIFPPGLFDNDTYERIVEYDETEVSVLFYNGVFMERLSRNQIMNVDLSTVTISATIRYANDVGYEAYRVEYIVPVKTS